MSKRKEPSDKDEDPTAKRPCPETTWQCRCGTSNDIGDVNCIQCLGRRHTYEVPSSDVKFAVPEPKPRTLWEERDSNNLVNFAQERAHLYPDLKVIASDKTILHFHRCLLMSSDFKVLKANFQKDTQELTLPTGARVCNLLLNTMLGKSINQVLRLAVSWADTMELLRLTTRYEAMKTRKEILECLPGVGSAWPLADLEATFAECKIDLKTLVGAWLSNTEKGIMGPQPSTEFWQVCQTAILTKVNLVTIIKHVVPHIDATSPFLSRLVAAIVAQGDRSALKEALLTLQSREELACKALVQILLAHLL